MSSPEKRIAIALLFALMGAGCSGPNPQETPSPPGPALAGPTWRLVAFGESANEAPEIKDSEVTAVFSEDGRFSGSAGCNRYFGAYEAEGGRLSFSQTGLTRRACPPPVMEREGVYLAALGRVAGWERAEDRLTLTGGAGEALLRFTAGAAASTDKAVASDTLSGEVFYRPRIALPPQATVRVRLEDVTRADAPVQALAEETILTEGRQVPIPFALAYDPTEIEPRRRYIVRAEIRRGGEGALLWTTDTAHPVLTQGAPADDVRVEVVQAEAAAGGALTSALTGAAWRLVQIETAAGETLTPEADTAYTITFQAGSRFGGRADCNSYGGRYEAGEDGRLTLQNITGTLAACGPDSQAGAFMRALNAASGYAVQSGRLRLTSEQGAALTFAREDAPEEMGTMPPQRTGNTYVYECRDPGGEDFAFTARTGPGELAVWLPARFAEEGAQERYLVLGQVRSASGAKYGSDGVVVWTKGTEEALLEVGGETFTDCTADPQRAVWAEARRRGVDFRAVGQEPGWHLEITHGERIRFVYAYGEREAVTPAPEPTVDNSARVYHAETEAHDLTVTITDAPCTDAMSGEAFEQTVTVRLGGRAYHGCGRSLH